MKKLNQTQQLKVETAKSAISKLQEAEAIIYSNLVEEIGEDNDWLYDYIFNCVSDNADDYTLRVKNEIFE
jgi:hypothetical protein